MTEYISTSSKKHFLLLKFESVQYSNHILLLEIRMFVKAINIIKTNFSAVYV